MAFLAQSIPRGQEPASRQAWQAWENGDIARAEGLALQVPGDHGRHLQFLTASVTGRYEEAVALHAAMQRSYRRYRELDLPLIEVYVHLGRYAEALRFAHARRVHRNVVDAVAARAQHALTVTLEKTSVIPFAEQPLAPYFPAVQMEINGRTLQAHVDTGGMHLVMSPDRARQLGIDLPRVPLGIRLDARLRPPSLRIFAMTRTEVAWPWQARRFGIGSPTVTRAAPRREPPQPSPSAIRGRRIPATSLRVGASDVRPKRAETCPGFSRARRFSSAILDARATARRLARSSPEALTSAPAANPTFTLALGGGQVRVALRHSRRFGIAAIRDRLG